MDELGHLGWVAHLSFELDGLVFGVRTDSRKLARWLEGALPASLLRDEEAEPNYSIVVGGGGDRSRLGRRFHVLYRDSKVLIRTFDAPELVRALLADLEGLTYGFRDDAAFVRAMFATLDGVAALLPEEFIGEFEEHRRRIQPLGLRLPASRYVAVRLDSGTLVPSPHALEIEDGAWRELAERLPSEPTTWPRVELAGEARVQMLCTMGSGTTQEGEVVQPVSRGWALYVLASNSTNLSRVGAVGLEALRRLVEGASCWEIRPSRPQLAARAALDLAASVAHLPDTRSA